MNAFWKILLRIFGSAVVLVLAALRTGRRPDHSDINSVMPRSFRLMNDVGLKALWAFLQTLPHAPTGR